MRNDYKNKTGFSLIEIMVSMLVLIAVVLGCALMIYQTGAGVQKGGNSKVAAEVVNELLERARGTGYDNLSNRSTNLMLNGINFTVDTVVQEAEHPAMSSVAMKDVVTLITYDGTEISMRYSVFSNLGIVED